MARIAALSPPYEPAIGRRLEAMMPPGVPPIGLFRTFVANLPMTEAMADWGAYELSRRLSLSMRDREILIDRTCARCGCEYEWGVHLLFYAERVGLTPEQVTSLTHGSADDGCWAAGRERLLVRAADALHDAADIDDALWAALAVEFTEAEILDVVFLCGWYHAISFAARAARVDLEPGAPRFEDVR
jgi:alkylhydroperoxidase family enzyme